MALSASSPLTEWRAFLGDYSAQFLDSDYLREAESADTALEESADFAALVSLAVEKFH